jgi:hypothetical protein
MPVVLLCGIGLGSIILSLPTLPRAGAVLATGFGSWYVPVWIASLVGTVLCLVGYWRMQRWGVYLYTAMFVVLTSIGLIAGLPFTMAGVLVPLLIIGVGFVYLRRMT